MWRGVSLVSKVRDFFRHIKARGRWLYVQMNRRRFYDDKYFKSRVFATIYSDGWRWAAADIWFRKHFGINGGVRWPISPFAKSGPDVEFNIDDLGIFFQNGNYFQTINGSIHIGKGTYFARNIGIITTNHDLKDPDTHQDGKDVCIGEKCWIGMNAMLLPGVVLGDYTVVGAGSVVTKSFKKGRCVIAGNPARIIKEIDS